MSRRSGTAVHIKRDSEILEALLDKVVVTVNHLLYGDAFFFSSDGYGNSVLITSTDEDHVLLLESEIAYIDVGRYVNSSQVSNMYTTISIRQGCRHGGTFKILLFHIS